MVGVLSGHVASALPKIGSSIVHTVVGRDAVTRHPTRVQQCKLLVGDRVVQVLLNALLEHADRHATVIHRSCFSCHDLCI